MTSIVDVTDATFQAEVLASDLPVVVDFWAPWCGPCKTISPVLEQLAADYSGRIKVVKVNSDENMATVTGAGIGSVPTLNFYSRGQLVQQVVGAKPKSMLVAAFDRLAEA